MPNQQLTPAQGTGTGGVGGTSKGRKRGKGRRGEDDYGYAARDRNLVRPPDQEKLTENQLKEEFKRKLTCIDPTKIRNYIEWSFKERGYGLVKASDEDQTVTQFHMDSELMFKEGQEEVKEYPYPLLDEVDDPEQVDKKISPTPLDGSLGGEGGGGMKGPLQPKQPGAEGAEEEEAEEDAAQDAPEEQPTKLLNQFNFCERGSQTTINPSRDKSAQTVPPPRSSYKDYCNAWIIFDMYENDSANRPKTQKKVVLDEDGEGGEGGEKPAEGEDKKPAGKDAAKQERDKQGKIPPKETVKLRKASVLEGVAAQEAALAKSAEGLKILERLVMQNIYNDVLNDFKYYDDASDEFRDNGEGTILPLWKFVYEKARKHHVTSISWSKTEPDIFAVSYGSFNFLHPITDGMVLIWSLRNTAFPEHIWMAPKGVMSCDIHPQQDCIVAVGLYDGNVALLQLRQDEDNTNRSVILRNCVTKMKHRSPNWCVRWADNDMDNNPNFYSCGMDGQVIHWHIDHAASCGGGGLDGTPIATLHLPVPPGCARCMTIHPTERTTFLVGTAEGNIFQCSMLYGSRFQRIYNAHFLPVAAVEWNYFHVDVFISCSEDWTIKVWDRNDMEAMYVFEIGVAILDCAWAPFSSTVFAAISEEGKTLVYDLNINKEKPVCCQQVVAKKKVHPNRVSFNPYYPIIIVGDDKGQLTTLKLSPNLRDLPRDPKGRIIEGESRTKYEINKMTMLLSLVRDPAWLALDNKGPPASSTLQAQTAKSTATVVSIMTTSTRG